MTTQDWTLCLDGAVGEGLAAALHALGLVDLQRYPPRRTEGLPLGHEVRILRRYFAGESSVLDPSGLAPLFFRQATPRQRALYDAFIGGAPASVKDWDTWIGDSARVSWIAEGLLVQRPFHLLQLSFRVIPLNGLLLVVDPLDVHFPRRVHIGQDSLNMVEFMSSLPNPRLGRMLDVGTGSGAILLSDASRRTGRTHIGADINPRAVRAARFNTRINQLHCEIVETDIFEAAEDMGNFDTVLWNLPLVFFPESDRLDNLDGYGGDMGIELTLRFLELLPALMTDDGIAVLGASAPVLESGSNVLELEVSKRLPQLGFDVSVHVVESSWYGPPLWDFHRAHGIARFEAVMIVVESGTGRLTKLARPPGERLVDLVRGQLYRLKYGCATSSAT